MTIFLYPLNRRNKELINQIHGLLEPWDWSWFVTVRLPRNLPLTSGHPLFIQHILRPITRQLQTRIGSISVSSYGHGGDSHAHLHAAIIAADPGLLGDPGEMQALLSATRSSLLSHRDALDIRPYNPEWHTHYIQNHAVSTADINYYDARLLAKLKRSSTT